MWVCASHFVHVVLVSDVHQWSLQWWWQQPDWLSWVLNMQCQKVHKTVPVEGPLTPVKPKMAATNVCKQKSVTEYELHCVSKRRAPFYFYDNFVRCRPIFIILSLADSSGFAIKFALNIPPHLTNVATLPCETLMSENSDNLKHV